MSVEASNATTMATKIRSGVLFIKCLLLWLRTEAICSTGQLRQEAALTRSSCDLAKISGEEKDVPGEQNCAYGLSEKSLMRVIENQCGRNLSSTLSIFRLRKMDKVELTSLD